MIQTVSSHYDLNVCSGSTEQTLHFTSFFWHCNSLLFSISQSCTCFTAIWHRCTHLFSVFFLVYYGRFCHVVAKRKQLSDTLRLPSGSSITLQPGADENTQKITLFRSETTEQRGETLLVHFRKVPCKVPW